MPLHVVFHYLLFIYNKKLLSLTTVWLKKYFCFRALAKITALSAISLKYSLLLRCWRMPTWRRFELEQCILYFQVIGKNRHLWASLTDENDSLLSWLRRSPIYLPIFSTINVQSDTKWHLSPTWRQRQRLGGDLVKLLLRHLLK